MTPKTYDAATELAIEERLRELAACPLPLEWEHGSAYAISRPGAIGFVSVYETHGGQYASRGFVGDLSIDVPGSSSIEQGKIRARDAIAKQLGKLRRSLLRANRALRKTTTKELKAQVAEQ